MAIGAVPTHDYVVVVKVGNAPMRVYGTFQNWTDAMRFRNSLPGKQAERGLVQPINGIG